MRMNFATGLILGVLLASVMVFAASGSYGTSPLAPFYPTGGAAQYTTAQTTSVTSSTTTASSSNGALVASGGSAPVSSKNTTARVVTNTIQNGATQSAAALQTSINAPRPSSLAAVVSQPSVIPLLLLPVLAALGLGFVLYRASVQKD